MKDKFLQCHFIRRKEQCVLIKAHQILIWVTLVLNYSPVSNTHNSRPAGFWEPVRPSRVRVRVYIYPLPARATGLFLPKPPPPSLPFSPVPHLARLAEEESHRHATLFVPPPRRLLPASVVRVVSLAPPHGLHERLAKLLVDSKYS